LTAPARGPPDKEEIRSLARSGGLSSLECDSLFALADANHKHQSSGDASHEIGLNEFSELAHVLQHAGQLRRELADTGALAEAPPPPRSDSKPLRPNSDSVPSFGVVFASIEKEEFRTMSKAVEASTHRLSVTKSGRQAPGEHGAWYRRNKVTQEFKSRVRTFLEKLGEFHRYYSLPLSSILAEAGPTGRQTGALAALLKDYALLQEHHKKLYKFCALFWHSSKGDEKIDREWISITPLLSGPRPARAARPRAAHSIDAVGRLWACLWRLWADAAGA
jgi:hypothetical protein